MRTDNKYLSLLWPSARSSTDVPAQTWTDLGIGRIAEALTLDQRRAAAIETIVRRMPVDETTIGYRLDITRALLGFPRLGDAFLQLVPMVERLRSYVYRPDRFDWTPLQTTIWRIRELEHYVRLLDILADGFESVDGELGSEGLCRLRDMVERSRSSTLFRRLQTELPSLLETAGSFRSIAVGINLDGGLDPIEATILAVGTVPYKGNGLAGRLLSDSNHAGVARLHSAVSEDVATNPMLVPLFKDLSDIMQKAARPLAAALSEFVGLHTRNLVAISDELVFYAGAVELARNLVRAGFPVCHPKLVEAGGAALEARGLYNLDLAIRRITAARSDAADVVSSDIDLPGRESIAIVTGPNSGGKTTFLQGVGLAQVVTQLGLFAPAERYALAPVDSILTHYPALEKMEDETGRFAEEAVRLRDLLVGVTGRSLVLLNETLSSTAMAEAVFMAVDVLDLLLEAGCRVVYVTHLHDLARMSRGGVVSLVAGMRGEPPHLLPTYRIEPGQPQGRSYAAALAARCGLDPDALRRVRGSLPAVAAG